MSMKLFHRLHKVNLVTSTIIETIDGDDYDLIVVRVGQQQQEKSFEAPNSSGSLSTKASSATNFDAVIIMILLLLLLNNMSINITIMVVARKSMGPGSQLSVDLERGIVLLTVF